MKKIIFFLRKHPIIANLIYIVISAFIILWVSLLWLDSWTGHGKTCVVPDVKGLSFEQASEVLAQSNLQAVLSDSIFSREVKPGHVTDQIPNAGAVVKPDKAVYITINAFARRFLTMPKFNDMSVIQARSMLVGMGFSDIREVEVAHDHEGEVVNVKYNGLPVSQGMKIPITASLTIEYGRGIDPDSVVVDDGAVLETIE